MINLIRFKAFSKIIILSLRFNHDEEDFVVKFNNVYNVKIKIKSDIFESLTLI